MDINETFIYRLGKYKTFFSFQLFQKSEMLQEYLCFEKNIGSSTKYLNA